MKKILITVAFIAFGITAFAQGGTLPFLRVNADARNAGMGNVTMGEATGMYLYTNPTSFLQDSTQKIYGSYTLGLLPKIDDKQIMYHAASVGYKHGKQALMVGFRYLGGAEIAKINSSGVPGKSIKPNDISIDLTYTRTLTDKFSAYITGSFIQSNIGKTATTGSVSAGVYYRSAFTLGSKKVAYNIGAGVYDLGGEVKYSKKSYQQPTSAGLGGSFSMEMAKNHDLNLAWTARYFILPTDASEMTAGLGLEYVLYKKVGIRAGYHMEDGNNITTVGLGYQHKMFNLNAAYQLAEDNTLLVGFGVRF